MPLRSTLGGELADVVFDATGSPAAMKQLSWPAQGGAHRVCQPGAGGDRFDDPIFTGGNSQCTRRRNSTAAEFRRIIAAD